MSKVAIQNNDFLTIKKKLEKDIVNACPNKGGYDYNIIINLISKALEEHDADITKQFFYEDDHLAKVLESVSSYRRNDDWLRKNVLKKFCIKNPSHADDIISNSKSEFYVEEILNLGFYSDINILNTLAVTREGKIQEFAAKACSISVLKGLKDCKNKNVRATYYMRIGAVDCLDDMLKDPIANNRAEGIKYAPYAYDKLKELVGEISRYPFSCLIEKISLDYIPMILANRNLKSNRWISSKVQERLDSSSK